MGYMGKHELLEAVEEGLLSWEDVAKAFLETCDNNEIYNVSYLNDFVVDECLGAGVYRPPYGCRSGVDDLDCDTCEGRGNIYRVE
jgi:hypothetical protein